MRNWSFPSFAYVPNAQGRLSKDDFLPFAADFPHIRERFPFNHLHVAFLFSRGGNLMACSTNRFGTRSRGAGFSGEMIHAERAVLKAVHLSALRGAKLVVIRINADGELRNSKPCEKCMPHIQKAMRDYGLARVYYSE